ncbi:transcriptional regulator [Streptomyces bingchenggensis BCW-1]|uniref:Transcriptional regulator n=1 Tax=Streptomyces bingchenggensis (strain BCW-1) TaxID=749414 RepID=D7C2Y2_STRBB|nr:transcriptional regulator [Streptomyces bingchenggensis BCW-1]
MPAPSSAFTGRDTILNTLTAALRPGSSEDTPPLHVVAGLAGVGKTELVLHVANRVLNQDSWFPGGVLFIDLFGYAPERRLSPGRALGSLLQALAVPDEYMPAELQDRARLYRSVLASYAQQGRRILVVLDNALDGAQVEPLLPGDPGIPVLVTSRHTLADLDARLHDLSVLDPKHAVDLLRLVLRRAHGRDDTRVDDAMDSAENIVQLCGLLPLALRIVAALLADQPRRPLSSMEQALSDTHRRLQRLSRGSLAVRAAFELSYQHLPSEQARLFRLLPVNPGPDISTDSAGRLADIEPYAAEEILESLTRGHLVETGASYGRWRMHDLIRIYADELGRSRDKDGRPAAVQRLLLHYKDFTLDAGSQFAPEVPVSDRFSRAAALSWLDDEVSNIVAAAPYASAEGYPSIAVTLVASISQYLMDLTRESAPHAPRKWFSYRRGGGTEQSRPHSARDARFRQGRPDTTTGCHPAAKGGKSSRRRCGAHQSRAHAGRTAPARRSRERFPAGHRDLCRTRRQARRSGHPEQSGDVSQGTGTERGGRRSPHEGTGRLP